MKGRGKSAPDDDAVVVRIKDGAGWIAGVNERSVLLGVYRFLNQLGCRWVRPGIDGEFIPQIDFSKAAVRLDESAAFRHRTICIEGAVSVENVLQMVDWAPKAGFSGYFMQFPFGNAFFERYYQRQGNPSVEPEPFSGEMARHYTIHIEQEIRKRSLIYHAVGHGWTCQALGMDVADWGPHYQPLEPGVKELLAEVKGKRDFQWDRPMITSLCFSSADVERRMVEVIARYAVEHPEVDLLHVWLDDGSHNKCECRNCAKHLPADLYIKMLRKLGKALDRAGSRVRIVFLSYSDLLWPPVRETADLDTERFVFMYANSRESYAGSLEKTAAGPLPEFVRNRYALKRDWKEFNAFLQGWQRFFKGDSFLFEYYMTVGRMTFDQYFLARVIYDDLRKLPEFGMNGITSCQVQRVFFPAGLAMYVLGQMLWDNRRDFEELVNDFFHASYGTDSALCKEFLKVSAEELREIVRFGGQLEILPGAAIHLSRLGTLMNAFRKVVERNCATPQPCHAKSWRYMQWYLRILGRMTALYQKMADAAPAAELIREWNDVKRYICENEDRYQPVFDVDSFCSLMDRYFNSGKVSTNPADVMR